MLWCNLTNTGVLVNALLLCTFCTSAAKRMGPKTLIECISILALEYVNCADYSHVQAQETIIKLWLKGDLVIPIVDK